MKIEYSRAVTPQVGETGNRLPERVEIAYGVYSRNVLFKP